MGWTVTAVAVAVAVAVADAVLYDTTVVGSTCCVYVLVNVTGTPAIVVTAVAYASTVVGTLAVCETSYSTLSVRTAGTAVAVVVGATKVAQYPDTLEIDDAPDAMLVAAPATLTACRTYSATKPAPTLAWLAATTDAYPAWALLIALALAATAACALTTDAAALAWLADAADKTAAADAWAASDWPSAFVLRQ